jgi:hypothetical protein
MIKVNERGEYSLMNIVGAYDDKDLTTINKPIRTIIEKSNHLLVNFALASDVKDSFFHFLKTLKYLLTDRKKCIVLIYLDENTQSLIDNNWSDEFDTANDLLESFEVIKNSIVYQPSNFLKDLVGSFMLELLVDFNFPSNREKIYIKEKQNLDSFSGQKTYCIVLEGNDIFFHLGISFTEESFLKLSENEDFSVEEFIAENISNTLKKYDHLNLITHRSSGMAGPIIEKKEFIFKQDKFTLFDKGVTVIIPIESFHGKIFFELWIPSDFQEKVLQVINS